MHGAVVALESREVIDSSGGSCWLRRVVCGEARCGVVDLTVETFTPPTSSAWVQVSSHVVQACPASLVSLLSQPLVKRC